MRDQKREPTHYHYVSRYRADLLLYAADNVAPILVRIGSNQYAPVLDGERSFDNLLGLT